MRWWRRCAVIGLSAVLVAAAWFHLTRVVILGVSLPTGNLARGVYLIVFLAMAVRVLFPGRPVAEAPALYSRSRWIWLCALPLVAGVVVVAAGVLDPQHLVVWHPYGSEFGNVWPLSFRQILSVWSPRAILDLHLEFGLYRPLKLLMFWLVLKGDAMTPSIVLQLGGIGVMVTVILLRWGATPWTAVAMGLASVIHPVALWSETAIDFYYAWAAILFLMAIAFLQALMDRPSTAKAAGLWVSFAASVLIAEIWLAGMVTLILLYRAESIRRADGVDPVHAGRVRRAMVVLCGIALFLLAQQIYANVRYPIRWNMLGTGWKLVARNIFFEPYWDFFVPFMASGHGALLRSLQMLAASVLIVFPATILFKLRAVEQRAAILWVTASVVLGPGLAFFDMADYWSTGRLTFGPNAFLAIAVGLMTERMYDARRARIMTAAYLTGVAALTLIDVLTRPLAHPVPGIMWNAGSTGRISAVYAFVSGLLSA